MNKFTWLHFSDLHFNSGDSFVMAHARKSLCSFLKNNNMSCDYLFITGDIADKGEYSKSIISIKELIDSISFNTDCENIFWSAGNHDIERGITLKDKVIRRIRENSNPREIYQKIMCDDDSIEKEILCKNGMAKYYKNYKSITGFNFSSDIVNEHRLVKELKDMGMYLTNLAYKIIINVQKLLQSRFFSSIAYFLHNKVVLVNQMHTHIKRF
jgi:hypothetical protein